MSYGFAPSKYLPIRGTYIFVVEAGSDASTLTYEDTLTLQLNENRNEILNFVLFGLRLLGLGIAAGFIIGRGARAQRMAARGYVHYHELLNVDTGEAHPTKVGWFKHTARTSFTRDGGPAPDLEHEVTPGIDFNFIPNWATPYNP